MAWTQQAGNVAAKQFILDYPTPRALRAAAREKALRTLLSTEVQALRMVCDHTENTLGYFLEYGGLSLSLIHAVVSVAAADVDVWIAADGTKTVRPR